jgi:hypothetical protein
MMSICSKHVIPTVYSGWVIMKALRKWGYSLPQVALRRDPNPAATSTGAAAKSLPINI